MARIGAPTLLGGAANGAERALSVHDTIEFEGDEWSTLHRTRPAEKGEPHRFDALPYT